MSSVPTSSPTSEEDATLAYVKQKNVHHLFELLASRVLSARPEDIFLFLREELTKIEEEEKRAHSHDPTKLLEQPSDVPLIKVTLAVFGLDNAGKTALISAMGGQIDKQTTATIGFAPVMFQTDKFDLCVFDLGGGANFRGIWPHYYHDCHGIIYVLDAADEKRLKESASVLRDVVQHKYIKGKPLLLFANKKDLPTFIPPERLEKEILGLEGLLDASTPRKMMPCCAIEEDPGVDSGVDWLLTTIQANYAALSELVAEHSRQVKEEKRLRLEEQRRRVEERRRQEEAEGAAAAA